MRLVYVNDIWFKNYSMNFVITPSFLARCDRDVTFHSLLVTRCLLLVVKSLVTRCKIRSLLVVEVARCKKSLVTRCKNCSLQKITRYSLQNSPVAPCRSGVTFCNFMKK